MFGEWIVKKCEKHDRNYTDVVYGPVRLEEVECGCQIPCSATAVNAIQWARQVRSIKQGDNAFGFVGQQSNDRKG